MINELRRRQAATAALEEHLERNFRHRCILYLVICAAILINVYSCTRQLPQGATERCDSGKLWQAAHERAQGGGR